MNKIFINEEAKKSTIILCLILTVFMVLQVGLYKYYTENQKQDYIDIIGAIFSKTIELNPELEKDIASLTVGNISNKEREAGRAILNEYGITSNINNNLFPNITDNFGFIVVSFLLSCLLIVLNYIQYYHFFTKIRKLTLAASQILEDDYSSLINEDKEGDFSKLTIEFSNIRRIIKNNISNTQNEKEYLVELLQNISHQLKTKLATMILYNDILLNRKITEEQRIKFLQDNNIQLNNMNLMIQSILKLAKLDVNNIEFCKKEESLNQTIKEVVYGFDEFANTKNIKLEVDEFKEIMIYQDKFWLKEAFNNIVKNCIEHTPKEGLVKISLEDTPVYNRVVIKDTGEGISQSDISNIFYRFYKSKTSNKKDSVGIGLCISKSIIESHNGYIDVKSEKGKGTSFIITFMKS